MSEESTITKPQGTKQYFEPVNKRTLVAFLYSLMGKLAKNEITPDVAIAQAKLASQINLADKLEQSRTIIQIKLKEIGALSDKEQPRLRNLDTKQVDY